jgi:hypothetical protein
MVTFEVWHGVRIYGLARALCMRVAAPPQVWVLASVLAFVLAPACRFDPSLDPLHNEAACRSMWFHPSNVDPCTKGLLRVGGLLRLTAAMNDFDTATSTIAASDGETHTLSSTVASIGSVRVRVVVISDFEVDPTAQLEIRGAHPALFIVHGTALIAGAIHARSGFDVECASRARLEGGSLYRNAAGAGGGGGGGFGGLGGSGSGTIGAQGRGMDLNGTSQLEPLRGGCSGGKGGSSFGQTGLIAVGGAGGSGGGALQLSVRDRLIVRGAIIAAGTGGGGGRSSSDPRLPGAGGGGGGGSGGAILLEARLLELDVAAVVCANGGSGGEGADTRSTGSIGADGTCSRAAITGTLTMSGGRGGDGAFGETLDGRDGGAETMGAGGGGGGSAGRVRIRSILAPRGAAMSPNAS